MNIPQLEDYLPTSVVVLGAVTVLALMVWVVIVGRRWGRSGGVVLLLLALAWVPLNKPIEGPILMRLGHDKGLVAADLLAIVAILIAGWRITAASKSEHQIASETSVNEST